MSQEPVSQEPDGQDVAEMGTTGMAGYPGGPPDTEQGEQPESRAASPGGMDALAETLASPLTQHLSENPPAPEMGEGEERRR